MDTLYLSGQLGQDDFESLRKMGGQSIIFPGWVTAWETKPEALGNLSTLEQNGEQKTKDVIFIIKNAKVLKFL